MARRVIGLDVGTHSVKVVHVESGRHANQFDVVTSAEKKLSDFGEGGAAAALEAFNAEGLLDGGMIVTGLAGVDAQVRSVDVPFKNAKKIEAVLGGILEAQLPLEMDDLLLSWFLQPEAPNTPTRVLVAFSRKQSVVELLEFLKAHRADPRYLTHKAAALIYLLQYLLQRQNLTAATAAIVDVGHESTSICVGTTEKLIAARTVLRGGANSAAAIARELRQTFLSLEAQGGSKVERVFLVGEASEAAEYAHVLSELLGCAVERGQNPEMAVATSYAMLGHVPTKRQNRFDFRKGELAFRGQTNWLQGRSKPVAIWSTIVIALLMLHGGLQNWVVGKEANNVKAQELSACEKVLGRVVESGSDCLSKIKRQISSQEQYGIPVMSAADYYLELAKVLPPTLQIKITDLDLSDAKMRMDAETNGFETIDQIVVALSAAKCMKNIEKGRARQSQDVIQFQITADLSCEDIDVKARR